MEIVYCCKCQRRILGDELNKGTAYQVGNRITCSACAVQVLETLPPKEKESLLAKMFRETKDRQSTPSRQKNNLDVPAAPPTPRPRPAAPKAGRSGLVAGLVVGAVAVVVALWAASGGSRDPVEEKKSAPPPSAPEDRRRQAAADAIRKARDFAVARPSEVDAQVVLWQEAVFAADRTPYLADAKNEHDAARLRQRDSMTKDLTDLDLKIAPLIEKQQYKSALDAIDAVRARRTVPEWTVELTRRSGTIDATAAKEFARVKDAAAAAKGQGLLDQVAGIRAKVAAWGLARYPMEFDRALEAVPAPKADPSLAGYWPLDEGSGDTAKDWSGKLTAKIQGATWTTGKSGFALRFDGVNSVLDLPGTPELDKLQSGDYTLAAWVSLEERSGAPDVHSIIVKPGYHMGLIMSDSGLSRLGMWLQEKEPKYRQFDGSVAVPMGQFAHVAGVVDRRNGAARLYVNGVLDQDKALPKLPAIPYGSAWRVGCATPGAGQYRWQAKAVIDEVRLYSRALTGAEIETLARAAK